MKNSFKVFLAWYFYQIKNKMPWIILCNIKCFIFQSSNVCLMLFCCRSHCGPGMLKVNNRKVHGPGSHWGQLCLKVGALGQDIVATWASVNSRSLSRNNRISPSDGSSSVVTTVAIVAQGVHSYSKSESADVNGSNALQTTRQSIQLSLNFTWIWKTTPFCFRVGCDWLVKSLQCNTVGKNRSWLYIPFSSSNTGTVKCWSFPRQSCMPRLWISNKSQWQYTFWLVVYNAFQLQMSAHMGPSTSFFSLFHCSTN